MNRVLPVTGYLPLKVKHLSEDQYHEYGEKLARATDDRLYVCRESDFESLWLAREQPPLVPAAPTPPDRYETPEDYARSNILQHNRTTWALAAVEAVRNVDVVVWFDYAIFKQGGWNGRPVEAAHVRDFLKRVEQYDFQDIPFPGIENKKPVDVHGNNWRFCGSLHIWPVKWLKQIDRVYKYCTREFIRKHGCVPLDLAIWPTVEERAGLPFRWYKAEYDCTQLTNFPGVEDA